MSNSEGGKSDVVFGAVFFVLAVFTLVMAYQIEAPYRPHVSLSRFPAFVAACMLALSVILLAKGIGTVRVGYAAAERPTKGRGAAWLRAVITSRFAVRFVLFAVLGYLYTQIIRPVGFVVATPVLVFGAMLLYGETKWYRLILLPVILTAILYYLFRIIFQVPLPRSGLW